MASTLLPIPASLKVTPKSVYVGDPKQLVDLLSSGVAAPILDVTRTKGNMPLFKYKLRCKTLFNGNLDIYFLTDFPNQGLIASPCVTEVDKSEIVLKMSTDEDATWECQDQARATRYAVNLESALNYWAVLMEEEVRKVYPDKVPVQVDRYAREGAIVMKPNVFGSKEFNLPEFLRGCVARNGTPCFKVAYAWLASTEDLRSDNHMWGVKFELSPYPQFPASIRVRKPISAAEKKVELDKKRKELPADDDTEEPPSKI